MPNHPVHLANSGDVRKLLPPGFDPRAVLQDFHQVKLAVVIPCYRVTRFILSVLRDIPQEVSSIYCVDDACPDASGRFIEENCQDPRVRVIYHSENQGVGGAMVTGYRWALNAGADIIVKLDGDGQMDPQILLCFVAPILNGQADYTKGNRFYWVDDVNEMPTVRVIGNAVLTFLTKLSSGYWNIFDPTNGYVAIHSAVLRNIPLHEVSKRYFFESDMLFYLGLIRVVVRDIPMKARYGDEVSNLVISRIWKSFLWNHLKNFVKRLFYSYYLRDFQLASVELLIGVASTVFGVVFGAVKWMDSIVTSAPATAGTVMIAALSIILGIQMLTSVLNYDIQNVPSRPIHPDLIMIAR